MAELNTKKKNKDLITGLMVLALIGGAFFIGRLTSQVEYLSKGAGATAGNTVVPNVAGDAAAAAPSNLTAEGLKQYAKDLGLDEGKFASCLDDGKYVQKVTDDTDYGTSLGVSGTPTFFINGVMIVGAQPQTEFEKIIDAELKDGTGDKATPTAATRVEVKTGVGPVRGAKDAKIKIVEFSDFECPFCKTAHPIVKALLEKYDGKISVEYRHYPLSFHPNAARAAQASECANDQGKFWEMHDKMFEG